jgi:hypothetical protein
LKGHGFSLANRVEGINRALASDGKLERVRLRLQQYPKDLKGHGFSRAERPQEQRWALAPEGTPGRNQEKRDDDSERKD